MELKIDTELMRLGVIGTGIAAVTVIVCYALSQGIDGTFMAAGVGTIGVMVGYIFKKTQA